MQWLNPSLERLSRIYPNVPKFRKGKNSEKRFFEKVDQNAKIVEFQKCQPLNRKFREKNPMEQKFPEKNIKKFAYTSQGRPLFLQNSVPFAVGNFLKFKSEVLVEWKALWVTPTLNF